MPAPRPLFPCPRSYFSRWTPEEQALYCLACVGGSVAWLAALVLTLLDLRSAWLAQPALQLADIPLAAALLGDGYGTLPLVSPRSTCDPSPPPSPSLPGERTPRGRKSAWREAVGRYDGGGSCLQVAFLEAAALQRQPPG